MNCPKCRTELIMHVQIGIACPSSYEGKISKSMLIKKHTQIEYAKWETASYDCPVCNYHHGRLGNYVTKLEDELAETIADLLRLQAELKRTHEDIESSDIQ